jgi:hypothetical protein
MAEEENYESTEDMRKRSEFVRLLWNKSELGNFYYNNFVDEYPEMWLTFQEFTSNVKLLDAEENRISKVRDRIEEEIYARNIKIDEPGREKEMYSKKRNGDKKNSIIGVTNIRSTNARYLKV